MNFSMGELKRRLGNLPDATAVIYTGIYYDNEGVSHVPAEPLGQRAAQFVQRILNGENVSDLPVAKVASPLIFEWPALQRWGISEKSLPPGSEILFRSQTAWEQYRAYILAVIAAILIQSALISWLLYEHWRRRRAEILARNTLSELTHVNRMATVGQLSASIAHEVRQPLSAILANAQAALRWLEKDNVAEVREGLNGIVTDGHRASDIIKNLRAMFKNDVQEKTFVDINKLILSVLALVQIDLQNQKIELKTQLDDRIPEVLGNQVHLQQVILNLVMNAIESMGSLQTRILRIKPNWAIPIRCMCRSGTPGKALNSPTSPGFFSRCSRPKRVVWEWAFRSANQSSKTMTAGFGHLLELTGARFSSLNCRRWR